MQWLKTWLMKWLGVDVLLAGNAELIQRLDTFKSANRDFGDLVWSEIDKRDRRIELLSQSHQLQADKEAELKATVEMDLQRFKVSLMDVIKIGEKDSGRITELESIVKDATLDTALAALEDRVSKIEAVPATAPSPQGRRGGSAWNSHQVAASAGAARANGVDIPIPTPGIS